MSLNRITPPDVKFELHAYGDVHDFSLKSIANWKDLEFTLKRDKTSGVFHQISFPFEFVLDAYDVVKRIFDTYKYRAVADMYIYQLKDNWPYVVKEEQYFEPQIFNLDWTTYDKSDNKIEIDTKRTSLYDFIKAKNKIVYDIPVSEIKEDKQWNFERIELGNKITFRCTSNGEQKDTLYGGKNRERNMGITYEETEIAVKDIVETKTLSFNSNFWASENKEEEDSYFMKLSDSADGTWLDFDINITGKIATENVTKLTLKLGKEVADLGDDGYMATYEVDLQTGIIEWHQNVKFLLNGGGWRCYLVMRYEVADAPIAFVVIDIDGTMNLNYDGRYKTENIDIIQPKTLLQSLINRITESDGLYSSDIEDFNMDNNNLIMMSAAESIRGIQTISDENDAIITEANVHTSYRNFAEWMNTFGYEQHITDSKLIFRKRYKSYRSDLIAIELEEKECADLRESVNDDYLYSGLQIGYQKKDYENSNGRYEFNGEHNYSTDLSLGENVLKLISPYRADCYGMEFLVQERGKNTTDDKSDKDLFLINVKEGVRYYMTINNIFSGNCNKRIQDETYNNTLFNGSLSPYHLMKMNQELLAVSVRKMIFTASDSNSKIIIDGEAINTDYQIPSGMGLFEPIIYNIASRNIQHLPSGENVNGLVRIMYKGETYEGFIDEVSKNPAWETETTWILHKRMS